MIRIMHVITDLTTGGAQMMLLKMLSGHGPGFQSTVVCLAAEGPIGSRISMLDIPVHNLGLRRGAPNPFRALKLRGITRTFAPHIIQGWMYHGNVMASLAGYWSVNRVPVLWNIRQALYDIRAERRMTATVIRIGARRSDSPTVIIYNSETSAQQHEAFGFRAEKRVLIPNGFDCERFRPNPEARQQVRAELGIGNDGVIVGLIARYHPVKGHDSFLRAARRVARQYRNVHFLLAGTGVTREEPALSKAVADNQLQDRVFLLGERSDIPRVTAALDIACSASCAESFSNAIGEAMACGVPCVVTDVGESAHIVGNTGACVAPRDPGALATAIGQLIGAGRDCRQERGRAARQRIEDNFSLPVVVRRYEDLYRKQLSD